MPKLFVLVRWLGAFAVTFGIAVAGFSVRFGYSSPLDLPTQWMVISAAMAVGIATWFVRRRK